MLFAPLITKMFDFYHFFIIFGANLMVQSTIIILVGLFFAHALKNKGAVVQSLILRVFLVAVLLCPLVSFFLEIKGINTFRIIVPNASMKQTEPAGLIHETDNTVLVVESLSGKSEAENQNGFISPDNESLQNIPIISNFIVEQQRVNRFVLWYHGKKALVYGLSVLWFICSAVLFCKLVFFYLRILYVRNTADDAEIETLRESKKIAHDMGVDTPLILQSYLVKSPFLTGLFKPAVLLPEDIVSTKEILIHEFAHLIRGDCMWNFLSHIGIALMPLQPLMRVLCSKIEDTSDYVCDDYVVKLSNNSRAYAKQLANLAQCFHPAASESVTGVGIVPYKSTLRYRIERLLEDSRSVIISAQTKVIVYVLAVGLGATVLTGFFGFAGEKVSAEIKIDEMPFEHVIFKQITANDISRTNQQTHSVIDVNQGTSARIWPYMKEKTAKNSSQTSGDTENHIVSSPAIMEVEPVLYESKNSVSDTTIPVEPAIQHPAAKQQQPKQTDNPVISTASYAMALPSDVYTVDKVAVKPESESESKRVTDYVSRLNDCDECILAGNELILRGEYALAEQVFLKALRFKPQDPDIHNYLGQVYFGKREYSIAILFFKKAANLKHNFADAYYNIGDVFFEKGNLEEAMKYYKLAIQINPGFSKKKRPIYFDEAVRRIYN